MDEETASADNLNDNSDVDEERATVDNPDENPGDNPDQVYIVRTLLKMLLLHKKYSLICFTKLAGGYKPRHRVGHFLKTLSGRCCLQVPVGKVGLSVDFTFDLVFPSSRIGGFIWRMVGMEATLGTKMVQIRGQGKKAGQMRDSPRPASAPAPASPQLLSTPVLV